MQIMKNTIKQISTILFLMYYVVLSAGMNISFHYCEGGLSDVAIMNNSTYCELHSAKSCDTGICDHIEIEGLHCDADEAHHCCSNENLYLTLDISPIFSMTNFNIQNIEIDIETIDNNTEIEEIIISESTNFIFQKKQSYPPPYLAFHSLVFYA